MTEGDTVVIAGLRCEVAEEAQRAWHSFIKNGFLFHTDRVLADWIRDEATLREFEGCVRGVCRGVKGFSGGRLVSQLRPLGALPGEERERLAAVLDRAFEEDFGPGEVARRVGERLDVLLGLVKNLASRDAGSAEQKEAMVEVRDAARALWRELETLPHGFWLPRRPRRWPEVMAE